MLDLMRRKKRLKLVLWLVIISLALGMLLLFVPGQDIGLSGIDNSVATVAGEKISTQDFYDTYRRFVDNYSANGRNKTDPETLKRLGVDKQALNALIQVRVVDYAANRLGLEVTPEEVRKAIESNPNLRNENGFIGVDAYKAVLAANRINIEQFEDGVRYMLLSGKVTDLLTDSLSVPEQQLRDNFARQNQEAQVQYVLFDKDAFKKRVNPTESELKAYFDANKDKYIVKEERRAQYLLLSLTEIADTVKVTDAEIDEEWTKENLQETVDASHILFKVDDPSKDAEVKAKAEAILKRAKAGEDFASLAKQYSEDEGSAPQGGELGSFPRGRMDKAFEDAAFALKPGEVSDLVRSQFGYHIIKVKSHDIPNKQALRSRLIRTIQVDKASEIAKAKSAEASKLAQTQKDLAAVAKELNVPSQVKETGFLERTSDPYANGISQEFLDEIFRLKEVDAIGNSVEVPAGYAVPKLVQINLPKPPEFEESRKAVTADFVDNKASDLVRAEAQRVAEEAKSMGDLAKAAQKERLTVKTSDSFKRDGTPSAEIGSSPDFTAAAFGLTVGGISGPIAIAGGKQVAVLEVKSMTPFDEAEFQKQKPVLREQALSLAKEAYFQEYIRRITDDLQKAGKIRINTQSLDQIANYRS